MRRWRRPTGCCTCLRFLSRGEGRTSSSPTGNFCIHLSSTSGLSEFPSTISMPFAAPDRGTGKEILSAIGLAAAMQRISNGPDIVHSSRGGRSLQKGFAVPHLHAFHLRPLCGCGCTTDDEYPEQSLFSARETR